jgi:hypothetical protein
MYGIYYLLLVVSCLVARIKVKGNVREFHIFVIQDWGCGMGCVKCESFLDLFFDVRVEFRHPSICSNQRLIKPQLNH